MKTTLQFTPSAAFTEKYFGTDIYIYIYIHIHHIHSSKILTYQSQMHHHTPRSINTQCPNIHVKSQWCHVTLYHIRCSDQTTNKPFCTAVHQQLWCNLTVKHLPLARSLITAAK